MVGNMGCGRSRPSAHPAGALFGDVRCFGLRVQELDAPGGGNIATDRAAGPIDARSVK
jgi:hypothetical protein